MEGFAVRSILTAMHKMRLVLLAFVLFPVALSSQGGKLLRIELDTREAAGKYTVLPLQQEGVLVIFPSAMKDEQGNTPWIVQQYDKNLVPGWRRTESLPGGTTFIRSVYADGKALLLFQSQDGARGRILVIHPPDGSAIPLEFELEARSEIHYFGQKGPWFLLGVSDRKRRSIPLLVDRKGKVTTLETGLDAEQWMDDAVWLPETEQLIIAFKYRASRRNHGIRVQAYGIGGNRQWEVDLPESNGRWHSAARIALLNDNSALIIGAFSLDERTNPFGNQGLISESASGFFTLRLANGQIVQDPFYYPFSEFNNYFSYLAAKDVSRMRNTSGEASPSLDFSVLIHDIRPLGDEYLLVAEAYYEKYHYVSRMAYDLYGRPVPSSYTVFDGYQYTNAFIAGFDSTGQKAWDNNLEIRDKLVKELYQFVDVLPEKDQLILAYVDEGQIGSQAIRGGQVTALFSFSPLEFPAGYHRSTEGEEEFIEYWYGRYALCGGYQKIRSLNTSGGERRTVFYLNKVIYR